MMSTGLCLAMGWVVDGRRSDTNGGAVLKAA
jgi:hypothetical protein